MHFSKTLGDVHDQVVSDDGGKWDGIVPCRSVEMRHGRLNFPQAAQDGFDGGLSLSPWALSQACQKVGVPYQYLKKCPPELQDENFNYWNRCDEIGRQLGKADRDPDAAWLIRCKGAKARGILSSRYTRLDNKQLLEALIPLLSGGLGNRFEVGLSQITPEAFHLRLVDPSIGRDVLPDDRLMVGIHVSNSEVGMRAVTVDALIFRLICTNGLIRKVDGKSLMRQRHIHVSEPRFQDMLAAAIREAVVVAAGFIEQMALAVTTPVPDPAAALDYLGEAWNLPKATVEMVKFALYGESQPESLYGLVNAVTQSAQRLDIEERVELETLASLLVDSASPSPSVRQLRARILSSAK